MSTKDIDKGLEKDLKSEASEARARAVKYVRGQRNMEKWAEVGGVILVIGIVLGVLAYILWGLWTLGLGWIDMVLALPLLWGIGYGFLSLMGGKHMAKARELEAQLPDHWDRY